MAITAAIKRHFGQESLDWFHWAYILDWFIVLSLWLCSYLISFWPVFERDFSPDDKSISHPHKHNQISSALNFGVALYIPIILLVVVGLKKRSLIDIHHGMLAIFAGRGLSRLVTEYLKYQVGRLRPDFLARCKWDDVANMCTGKKSAILEGRKSFPSGHSSTAFAGMIFITLWLAGQTAAFCPSVPKSHLYSSRMFALILTLIPFFWAIHVAVTRVEDYRHHKEDVLVGALIGTVSASLCYLLFWPSPFHSQSFNTSGTSEPREHNNSRQTRQTYELTAMEDNASNV